jgi:hypothetical protein
MSFPAERIEDYLLSRACNGGAITEVPFTRTKIGDMEIVIVSEDKRLVEDRDVSEEEIEQQLAREGLIRVPSTTRRTRNEFKPIDVAGKPISEMIIEERR